MQIDIDDLTGHDVAALLRAHVADMRAMCPPESCHTLDLDALRRPEITLWTAREDGVLAGCAALKHLDAHHGEIKIHAYRAGLPGTWRGVAAAAPGDR
jgi:putative acetyltransferase